MKLGQQKYNQFHIFPFYVRFGAACVFRCKVSKIIGLFLILLWKMQALSLTLLISIKYFVRGAKNIGPFLQTIAKYFVISDLLDFTNGSKVTAFIFCSFQGIVWTFLGVTIYIGIRLHKQKSLSRDLQVQFSFFCYFFPLMFLFANLDLYLPIIKHFASGELDIFGKNNALNIFIVFLSSLALIWSITFSFLLFFVLTPPLKTKDPLSSKCLFAKRIELFQRILICSFLLFLPENEVKQWCIVILDLALYLIRDQRFYNVLPYYKIYILKADAFMNGICTSLSLLNLICQVGYGNFAFSQSSFILYAFLLFTPMAGKIYVNRLERLFQDIIRKKHSEVNPYQLLHRLVIYKYMLKKRSPQNAEQKYNSYEEIFIKGKNASIKVHTKEDGQYDLEILF